MSDSELSDSHPTDMAIEVELRQVVGRVYRSGNHEELTVRRIRGTVEQSLGLAQDFLKSEDWKARSKSLIEDEVGKQEIETSTNVEAEQVQQKKRPSTEVSKPAKRRKTSPLANESKESRTSRPQLPKGAGRNRKATIDASDSENDVEEAQSEDVETDAKSNDPPKPASDGAIHDESELSDVIDEEPKPRRKKKASSAETTSKSAGKRGRPKNDKSSEQDPEEEEIKRLKGWLVKCGIRKMWYRELQSCDTNKSKILHLKEMLADAGMSGRYSIEKASQIRESRELAADLEAVQAGAKHWGKSSEDEVEDGRPARRRVARGLEGLDFLSDNDGAETD